MIADCRLPLLAALSVSLLAGPAGALPLISEVFYDAVGSDNGLSFIEISGLPGTSLDDFVLESVNGGDGENAGTITLSGVIPASGLFVVADESSSGVTAVPNATLLRNFDLQNGPDSLLLRNSSGVVDALGYGSFASGEVFAGEGMPAIDPPAGSSLARLLADVDQNDNSLDFTTLSTPTPGSAFFGAVPEPGAGSLLAGGLLLLADRSRRRGFAGRPA